MAPDIQVFVTPDDEDVYAAPDVTRLGTVDELTEGNPAFAVQGDFASIAG